MAVGWLLRGWFSSLWNWIITRGVKRGRRASCWASCWGSNVLHLVGAVVCSLFRTITSITTGHIQWNYITDNSGDWHWLLFIPLSWVASVLVAYNNATSTIHRVVFFFLLIPWSKSGNNWFVTFSKCKNRRIFGVKRFGSF